MLLQYKTTYDDDGGTETLWVPDLEHVYEDEIAALRAANADPDIPMFYCTQEFEIKIGAETVKKAVEGMLSD